MNPARDVVGIVPISRRTDACELASAAYQQLIDLLESLHDDDWAAPTDCPPWTVADVVGHLIGAGRAYSSLREFARQQLYGLRHRKEFDGNAMDAYNALQVAEQAGLTPQLRVDAVRREAAKAVAGRMRLAPMMSLINASVDQSGSTAAGMPARENGGHLFEVVLTRDVWLHTVDIARAVGRKPDVTAPFNGRIIDDAVAEWAKRHGRPFELHLTGPAGGTYTHGTGGEHIAMDAVEFARTLSGRTTGGGLLATRVLF